MLVERLKSGTVIGIAMRLGLFALVILVAG